MIVQTVTIQLEITSDKKISEGAIHVFVNKLIVNGEISQRETNHLIIESFIVRQIQDGNMNGPESLWTKIKNLLH